MGRRSAKKKLEDYMKRKAQGQSDNHCGTFIKCNNAEGCFGCEYENEGDSRAPGDGHPPHPDNN